MGETKIIVTEIPESKEDCPFYKKYPDYECSIGGECSYYRGGVNECEKLVPIKDVR